MEKDKSKENIADYIVDEVLDEGMGIASAETGLKITPSTFNNLVDKTCQLYSISRKQYPVFFGLSVGLFVVCVGIIWYAFTFFLTSVYAIGGIIAGVLIVDQLFGSPISLSVNPLAAWIVRKFKMGYE